MKFYKIKNSLDIKEIGTFAQVEEINKIGDLEQAYAEGRKNPIINQWEIPELILNDNAIATSFLNVIPFSNILFLVFKKLFIDFIVKFNVGEFSQWSLKVHYRNNILTDYDLFHLSYPMDLNGIINFEASDFLILPKGGRFDNTPTKKVLIENYKSYVNHKQLLNESNDKLTVTYDQLILDFSRIELDLIRFIEAPFTNGYYISERLKNAIEREGFTGIAFQEIKEMDKRLEVHY